MADIFLSYAREDLATAKQLAQALEEAGLSVWWDRRLLAGQQFSSEIEREIDGAEKVVVLWSENASKSRWVRDEASAGAEQGKLCPVQIDGARVPLGFRQFHTIDLQDWDGRIGEPSVAELVAQLREESVKTPSTKTAANFRDPVLAVLPFDNLSIDKEMGYFSDGISDEILTRLMHGSNIKLMGRGSSFQFRDERKGAATKELDCTHILDGSIRRAGQRVRTTVHLLEVASDQVIWSDRFDDDLEDILDTQDRISKAIASALNGEFDRSSKRRISADVYDRYLKAKISTWDLETLGFSIEQLREITKDAPKFADAWAQLAMWSCYYSYVVPPEKAERYRAMAERAVIACERLQYEGVEPLIARFRFHQPFGAFLDVAPVVDRLRVASANGPAGQVILSMHYADIGMTEISIEHAKLGFELDPQDMLAASMNVMSVYYAGANEQAAELMKDYLSVNPENHHVVIALASCAAVQDDWATIDRLLDPNRLECFPLHEYSQLVTPLRAMQTADHSVRREAAERMAIEAAAQGAIDVVSLCWISKLDGADRAYKLLESVRIGLPDKPNDEIGPALYGTLSLFVESFHELREDPRFPELAARLGLAQYWSEKDLWPDCTERLEGLYPFKQGCRDAAQSGEVDSFLPPNR